MIKLFYKSFCASVFLVIIGSIFFDAIDYVIIFKVIGIISLCGVYLKSKKEKSSTIPFLLSMLVAIIGETVVATNFEENKKNIYIIFSIYYILNMIVIWSEIKIIKFKSKRFFSIAFFIGTFFLAYLCYTIIPMVYHKIADIKVYMIVLVATLLIFCYGSFYIYFNKPDTKGIWLLAVVFCFVFLNVIVGINHLYYYSDLTIVIINIMEMASHFFMVKYLLSDMPILKHDSDILLD